MRRAVAFVGRLVLVAGLAVVGLSNLGSSDGRLAVLESDGPALTQDVPPCPPDPMVPGFQYVCGPGAAAGHRGFTCISHPPECPVGSRVIAVDPTNSDPDCVVANEAANARAGGAQLDPYGDCPPRVAPRAQPARPAEPTPARDDVGLTG